MGQPRCYRVDIAAVIYHSAKAQSLPLTIYLDYCRQAFHFIIGGANLLRLVYNCRQPKGFTHNNGGGGGFTSEYAARDMRDEMIMPVKHAAAISSTLIENLILVSTMSFIKCYLIYAEWAACRQKLLNLNSPRGENARRA